MKFGLVLSPADYGLFIESTNRSATTEKNILVRHTAVAGTEAVIGYTEDIPVELVP
jgi:hypothetical protein